MEDARRHELRRSFLEHLLIFRRVRNKDTTLFGTLIDSWYAYVRGGVFIKDTENPRTLNNPTGRLEREAMIQLPYVSQGAGEVLHEGRTARLVREHSIPKAHLRELFLEELLADVSLEEIETWLRKRYHVAAVTQEEHDALPDRARMPVDWDGNDGWRRYLGLARYVPHA